MGSSLQSFHALVCRSYMGMENGDIPNQNIQASSIFSPYYPAWNARLNGPLGWISPAREVNPWIQADIGYQTWVTGVVTQGYDLGYVTSLKISTFSLSTNDTEDVFEDEHGNEMVIPTLVTLYC